MQADYTDRILREWAAVRPDVDASPIAIGARIQRLAHHLLAELDEVASGYGLSTKGDFDTLAALRRHAPSHAMSPTRLAAAALITTGGMTSRLDRLEEAGLVERQPDPDDRRALLVHLTTRGQDVVDDVLESNLIRQKGMVEVLDKADRLTLVRILRELLLHFGDG